MNYKEACQQIAVAAGIKYANAENVARITCELLAHQSGAAADYVALVEKLDEYAKLLGDEIEELASIAVAHGWGTSRQAAGEIMRTKINKLREAI